MIRRKLLFLCQTVPFPPDGGVRIRSFYVLKALAQQFDVHALCFERAGVGEDGRPFSSELHASQVSEELGIPVEMFRLPQARSRARFIWDHSRSVLTGTAFTEYLYDSREFAARLRTLLVSGRFDLVHVDSLDLSRFLPATLSLPVVLVHHNVESQLLARRSQVERGIRRPYMALQGRLTAAMERRWVPRVSLNIAVSEGDAQSLRSASPSARVAVVPNGVDTEYFTPSPVAPASLVFVGSNTYFPNLDALRYFSTSILPALRARVPAVHVNWVGTTPPDLRREFGSVPGLHLTGYVDDIRPYVQAARCFVVPLRIGGGTRLKVLGAWAMARPVVSSSVGCEGLEVREGRNVLLGDTPTTFVDAVCRVLNDDVLARRLGLEGRTTVERHYGWSVVTDRMLELYDQVLAGRPGNEALVRSAT